MSMNRVLDVRCTHMMGFGSAGVASTDYVEDALPVTPPICGNDAGACLRQHNHWVCGKELTSMPAVVVPAAPMAGM